MALSGKDRMRLKNKVAGSVYGFAIGDAMGATTEFMDKKSIHDKYGTLKKIVGGGWLGLKAGEVTDDTQMTMCVADALMRSSEKFDGDLYTDKFGVAKAFRVACAKNFIEWAESDPPDIGGQCARGIDELKRGCLLEDDMNALGNGSLMRAMPCALVMDTGLNVLQSDLTHPNEIVRDIIMRYSDVIRALLLSEEDKPSLSIVSGLQIPSESLEPSGEVRKTFNNALYWAGSDRFDKCLLGSVNDGGDADTIAAIACSIAGARFGIDSIPGKHIAMLSISMKVKLGRFIDFVVDCLEDKLENSYVQDDRIVV